MVILKIKYNEVQGEYKYMKEINMSREILRDYNLSCKHLFKKSAIIQNLSFSNKPC